MEKNTRRQSLLPHRRVGEKVAEGRMRGPSPESPSPGASRHPLPQAGEGTPAPPSLESIAALLQYPDAPLLDRAAEVPDFRDEIAHVSVEGLQQLYTTTFDLNPVATLEVGWHLWGEQYERGRFLADLRAQQDALGLDPGTELPDHLTVLLPMLARQEDGALAAKVTAALEKIAKPLDEHGNPYRHVIHAARSALAFQYPAPSGAPA